MKKIAINDLGRIGRLVLRHYLSSPLKNLQIVAANDLTLTDKLAYLLQHDYEGDLHLRVCRGSVG